MLRHMKLGLWWCDPIISSYVWAQWGIFALRIGATTLVCRHELVSPKAVGHNTPYQVHPLDTHAMAEGVVEIMCEI